MIRPTTRCAGIGNAATWLLAGAGIGIGMFAFSVSAAQIDIPGPAGSVAFGTTVTVLPNGNIVVTDPLAGPGAVHLYSPGGALISTLTGTAASDQIGSGGIVQLTNGNFVVVSPVWRNGAALNAGAVTWVNGVTGLAGNVSTANSLVGGGQDDRVGTIGTSGASGVVALNNGNYVVASSNWSSGATTGAGAVTWANGTIGRTGEVSPFNSLTGSTRNDFVGVDGVTALTNGHYVVRSSLWSNGATTGAGAVTWGNGNMGVAGEVSSANSLVGTAFNDLVGSAAIGVLNSGNYVVVSPSWSNGLVPDTGAVTWANGATGRVGVVAAGNSLIGSTESDRVGFPGVTELTNGNYVVRSSEWDSATGTNVGAVTWGSGSGGLAGVVGASNSLVGTVSEDRVGDTLFVNNRSRPGVTALGNGNYVVVSSLWDNGATLNVGAVTWASGVTGSAGAVSSLNSLIGTTAGDKVGSAGARALANDNFVVLSPLWTNGASMGAGAATWALGNAQILGEVAATNSLIGTASNDGIGSHGLAALTNGNYVVLSPFWNNGSSTDVGAATWANGGASTPAIVGAANSLIGSSSNDFVGFTQVAILANGNYVVSSPNWDNAGLVDVGAVTLANGGTGRFGAVSSSNSLIGSTAGDAIGNDGIATVGTLALSDGNYAVVSEFWDNAALVDAGAVTLARGDVGVIGTIQSTNSVLGTAANGGDDLVLGYDAPRGQLIVGRPDSNLVSLFTLGSAEVIFANGFE